jgi:LPS-assembly protein
VQAGLAPLWRRAFAPPVMRRLLILGCFGLAFASLSPAATSRPTFDAKTVDTDPKTGEFVLTGNARFEWQNALLLADEIRYNPKTQIAAAQGNVSLTRANGRLLADRITYNVDEQWYTLDNLRLGQYPFYVSGSHAEGNRTMITVNDAVVSYTEPYALAPSLKAGTLIYIPDQSISAESARIGLGTTVPVRLPKFQQNLHEPLLSYMDAHFGYRASLGAHLGIGALVPVAPGTMVGGDVAFYTKRGLLFGPSAQYDTNLGGQDLMGSFRTGYIHDYGDRLQDVLARPIQKDRGFIDWSHHQDINSNLTVLGELHYWSDSEIIRDFSPEEFYRTQTPDSFLEGVYTKDNYVVSLFTRVGINRYQRVQQRLPELRFDLMPTPIGGGIYERFQSSIAVLDEEALAGFPELDSKRADVYYGLNRPFAPNDWFTFTPVAGGRLTHYFSATGGKDDYTRALGEIGFDAHVRASAVFDYKNERWNIDGIRHLLTPRLSYRYIPDAEKGRRYIPAIDRTVFSTYLQPLGLGDQRNIDELRSTNTLRIGIDNTFQTRDKEYGSRDLLIANFAADLRFERMPEERNVSEIHTELAFMPAKWLQFDLYQSVNSNDLSVHELNTGVRVYDSKAWSLRLGNHYLEGQFEEYLLDGRYRLNESYEVISRLHFDAQESRFVERSIGLRQTIHNLWSIEYALSFYSGRRRESNFGFALRIDLAGL